VAVWLHAKVHECGLGLWPRLNAAVSVAHSATEVAYSAYSAIYVLNRYLYKRREFRQVLFAGKTESTKLLVQHIVHLCSQQTSTLQQQIIEVRFCIHCKRSLCRS